MHYDTLLLYTALLYWANSTAVFNNSHSPRREIPQELIRICLRENNIRNCPLINSRCGRLSQVIRVDCLVPFRGIDSTVFYLVSAHACNSIFIALIIWNEMDRLNRSCSADLVLWTVYSMGNFSCVRLWVVSQCQLIDWAEKTNIELQAWTDTRENTVLSQKWLNTQNKFLLFGSFVFYFNKGITQFSVGQMRKMQPWKRFNV